MQRSEAYKYIIQSERRTRVLCSITQPLTARQLCRRTGLSFDGCRDVVRQLAIYALVRCLNDTARRSRLYWLTETGKSCQRQLFRDREQATPTHFFPTVDWELYGSVCFSQRAAIIKALVEPLQPAAVKRKARSQSPGLRMSANNVRDIIRPFLSHGIVRPVCVRRRAYPRYELTDTGKQFQQLLRLAEVPT